MFTIRLALFVLLASACVTGKPKTCKMPERLSIQHQYRSAVKLRVTQQNSDAAIGSGVAVSPRHVVTAAHVVEGEGAVIEIKDYAGNEYIAKALKINPILDIAVVEILGPKLLPDYQEPVVHPAAAGDEVCSVGGNGYTHLLRKCGYVAIDDSQYGIVAGIPVVPGNSGAGVWFGDALVGIVVRGVWQPGIEHIVAYVPFEKWAGMLPIVDAKSPG